MAVRKNVRRARAKPAQSPSTVGIINVGHQIWLAGLGALARAQREGPKLFDALVEEGSSIHERKREQAQRAMTHAWSEVRDAIDTRAETAREKAGETWDNVEKIFQTRVQRALQQLGVPSTQEIRSLSRKVNELTRSVQELAHAKPRTRAKAASARKAANTRPVPPSAPGAAL